VWRAGPTWRARTPPADRQAGQENERGASDYHDAPPSLPFEEEKKRPRLDRLRRTALHHSLGFISWLRGPFQQLACKSFADMKNRLFGCIGMQLSAFRKKGTFSKLYFKKN